MPSVTISGIIPAQLAPAEKALPISRSEKRLNQNRYRKISKMFSNQCA
jgi:hypothetical protein